MSAREKLVSRVLRALGLRDLTPMPMMVLDPILDETIDEVVEYLRARDWTTASRAVEQAFSRTRFPG